MKAPKTAKPTKKPVAGTARPYNRYNVYFILERERIVLSKGGATRWTNNAPPASPDEGSPQSIATKYYAGLVLPPLPPRFCHLNPPEGWCVPFKDAGTRRKHRKSHGVATFRELSQCIATSWKAIDDETMAYCLAVEKALKERHADMMKDPMFSSSANDDLKQAKSKQIRQKKVVTPQPVMSTQDLQIKPKQVRQVSEGSSSHGQMTAASPLPPPLVAPEVPQFFSGDFLAGQHSSAPDAWAPLPLHQNSTLPPPPAIINEFFGNDFFDVDTSANPPARQPEPITSSYMQINDNGTATDAFTSLVASVSAPRRPSNEWKWASDANANDRTDDANVSDDEIRWMWNLQH